MDKKYYIAINGEKFEVSKEVYNTYYKGKKKNVILWKLIRKAR